jgi:hypothetical protein
VFTEAFDDTRRCGLLDYADVICLPRMKANSKRKIRLGQLNAKKTKRTRRRIMSLRKFREFIQDGHRPASSGSELNVLEEETHDSEITDAATVIIGSELSTSERKLLADSLVNDVKKMSEGGGTIMAMAVVLE